MGKRHHNLWTEEWSALIMMGTPVEWRALSTIEPSRRWKFHYFQWCGRSFGAVRWPFQGFRAHKKVTMDRCYFGIFSERHFRNARATKCSAFFLFRCCFLFSVFLKATFFLDHCSQESLSTHWVFRLLKCPKVKSQPCFLIMSPCFLVESPWISWFWAQTFLPPTWNPARSIL